MTRLIAVLPALLAAAGAQAGEPLDTRHGFRVGYTYAEHEELTHPHLFVMGYELSQRKKGGAGLDVLFVQNVMVSGLNQSRAVPSGNLLVGASIADTVEVGVGPNLTLSPELTTNMVAAVGITVPAGEFDVPVHLAWVSDAENVGRVLLTTGVNWGGQRHRDVEESWHP
jgi:hypothetical protein